VKISKKLEEFVVEEDIYGVHTGSLTDAQEVKNCPEQTLYFLINSLAGFIRKMNQTVGMRRKEGNVDLSQEQYALEFCVYQTKRFGVEIPEPTQGKHVVATPSYRAWFKSWSSYFQEELSETEFKEYDKLSSAKLDISKFRPKVDWRENIID